MKGMLSVCAGIGPTYLLLADVWDKVRVRIWWGSGREGATYHNIAYLRSIQMGADKKPILWAQHERNKSTGKLTPIFSKCEMCKLFHEECMFFIPWDTFIQLCEEKPGFKEKAKAAAYMKAGELSKMADGEDWGIGEHRMGLS